MIPASIKSLLREPLLNFIVLGAALFIGYTYLKPDVGLDSPHQIALTLDELAQLEMLFESQWHRPPTPEEFTTMIESKVRQKVLYREALVMGLDKNDEIVERRMAQKMQFLAEDIAATHEPTSEELRTWFAENGDRFALPGRVSFRHLYFSPDQRGTQAYDEATRALARLAGEPVGSEFAESLGDRFMYRSYYADQTSLSLAKDFGPSFAVAISMLTPDAWQGPIESGYGWHLVYINSLIPGRVPDFEEVQQYVKTAWLGDQKAAAWQRAYDDMRAKYTVLLPVPPENMTKSASGAVTSSADAPAQVSGAPL